MPAPANLKPVQTNLFGSDASRSNSGISSPASKASPAKERPTHIEVCARIRPLQISMQSSSSYFGGDAIGSSPARKPPIPNSRIGMGTKKTLGDPPGYQNQPQQSKIAPEDLFYAWDVVGTDTATQSPKTEIIPGRTHTYTLDKVYDAACSTNNVYEKSVKPLVTAAMEGYHSAVLAYGQTSTGKTFTMTGTPSSPGIVPLAIHECFQCLEKNREYLIRVSYLEVYKEQIRDLLAEGVSQIRLFDHREQGLIIKGLREEVVTCPKQIFEILAQGEKRRKIGATNMNQHSSRSHVMVRMWIESRATSSGSSSGVSSSNSISSMASSNNGRGSPVRVSSLSLVDLAGSESVRLHGADETRRQEGHYINKSLMALGKVVYALSEQGKQKDGKLNISSQHIPYRDSKLTRLLQPSLSGNAQMVLISCISPLVSHLEESHNTFKFATRAKKIPQKATIQESIDEKTLLQTYREEIEALRQQLKDAKKQQEALLREHQQRQEPLSIEDEDVDDEVKELRLAIRNMEHLILKSKTAAPSPSVTTRTLSDDDFGDSMEDTDDENDEAALLALMDETQKSSVVTEAAPQTPPPTSKSPPETDRSDDMYAELHRIQGLLGSVLKKRARSNKSPSATDGNTMNGAVKNAAELNQLRAQLEQQEVASSLRKADAHFLQKQLEEKDELLQEVSKILEQVEQRQIALEAENAELKKELLALKAIQSHSLRSPSWASTGTHESPIVDC